MKKRILSAILALTTMLSSSAAIAETTNYSDVPAGAWYESYLTALTAKNAISGYEDGTFRPDGTVTVAEFIKTIIGLTVGDKGVTNEAGKHWAHNYIGAAERMNLITESDIAGRYDDPIDRGLMSVITSNVMTQVLGEPMIQSITDVAKLTDWDTIKKDMSYGGWVGVSVAQCYCAGIFTGYEDGSFRPDGNMTRAEMCAVMIRLIDETQRKDPSPEGFWLTAENLSAETLKQFQTIDNLINCGFLTPDKKPTNHYVNGREIPADSVDYVDTTGNYSYKAQSERPVTKIYQSDPFRPPVREGDTFVTTDGTEYLVEATPVETGNGTKYAILGLGLPVAFDLGRENAGIIITNDRDQKIGDYPISDPRYGNQAYFGCEYSGEDCREFTQETYYVYDQGERANGEGHTAFVWSLVTAACPRPDRDGAYDGEYSEDGYWRWDAFDSPSDMYYEMLAGGWMFVPHMDAKEFNITWGHLDNK